MKKLVHTLAWLGSFLLLNLFSSVANAQCFNQPFQAPASIAFDTTLPVGAVLWTGNIVSTGFSNSCPAAGRGTFVIEGIGTHVNNIYDSGIPGVGYRAAIPGGLPSTCSSASGSRWPVSCAREFGAGSGGTVYELQLIRTGDISGGGVLTGKFGRLVVNGQEMVSFVWAGSVTVRPTSPTCAITVPPNIVQMGNIPRSVFTGLNSTSTSQPLNIGLLCSGGDVSGTTAVRVTLTDITDSANRSTSLSLTSDSSARGIAIQVLKDGVVLGYGPASNANGNTNQWLAGTARNGVFNIPLTARYVQTGPAVTAGSANGRATFTMNYQ